MNDSERPTSEKVQQIEDQARQKTEAELVQEFEAIRNVQEAIKNEVDDPVNEVHVRTAQAIPSHIRGKNNNEQKLTNITDVVRQTIEAIKLPNKITRLSQTQTSNQRVLIVLVNSIDIQDVNSSNAIYIYEILHRGMEGQLATVDQLIEAFQSVKNLQFIGTGYIYEKISDDFINRAQEFGATKEQLNKLRSDAQKITEENEGISKKREQNKKVMQDYENIQRRVSEIIDRLDKNRLVGTRYEREINEGIDKSKMSDPQSLEDFKDIKRQERIDIIKIELMSAFGDILGVRVSDKNIGVYSERELLQAVEVFKEKLAKYNDLLKTDEYEVLTEQVSKAKESGKEFMELARVIRGQGLLESALTYTKMKWTEPQIELLKALDSREAFIELSKKYNEFRDKKDWTKFATDVRKIFDRLFSIPEAQPDAFWQEAFNQLHEGHLYKLFIQQLSSLSTEINDHPVDGARTAWVWDFYNKQEEWQSVESHFGPNIRETGISYHNHRLGDAVNILRNRMITLGNVKEYIHNNDIIARKGMGFDKVAEYSANVNLRDIDWVFREYEGLSDTYQLYLQELGRELALNYHVLPTDLGNRKGTGMDSTEMRVYKQLAAKMGIVASSDVNLIRLIRMASGIATSVYGETWGLVLTARMPILYDIKRNYKDKKFIGQEVSYKPVFQSLHYAGFEKMAITLDWDLLFQRMKLPRYYKEIRFAYAPRVFSEHGNIDSFGHDVAKEAMEEYHHFEHGNIYTFGKMADQAWFCGRSNELADFDNKFQFLNERYKTSSVDYFSRAGWRFTQNRGFFVWQRETDGKLKKLPNPAHPDEPRYALDFPATIQKLQGIGPHAIRLLIDDIIGGNPLGVSKDIAAGDVQDSPLSIENLDPAVYQSTINKLYPGKKLDQLTKDQRSRFDQEFRIELYKKYIFDPLIRTRPTQMINMEQKRWIPEDELLLSERIKDKLYVMYPNYSKDYINSFILPLHIGAISMAENEVWDRHKGEWKKRIDEDTFHEKKGRDPFDYSVTEADFEDKEHQYEIRNKLIAYFNMTKTELGEQTKSGEKITLSDEEFINHIKETFRVLREGISDSTRRNRAHGEGKLENLSERFSYMMVKGQGTIDQYIHGNLFDFSEYFLQQAGSRAPERMWGEVAAIAQKFTPKTRELLLELVPNFILGQYPDIKTLEHKAVEILGPALKEMKDAVEVIDIEQAHGDMSFWITTMCQLMGKDWWMRYNWLGRAGQDFVRRSTHMQGSFFAEHFKETMRRPVVTLGSEEMESVAHGLMNHLKFPQDKDRVVGIEKFLGIINLKPIYDKSSPNKSTMEAVIETLNLTGGQRAKEAIPAIPVIIALLLMMLAHLATKKNKEK